MYLTSYLVIMALFRVPIVRSSSSVILQSDIDECGPDLFRRVTCRSVNGFYRECMVPGATEVLLIKLHENLTDDFCGFRVTFGFRENVIWVNKGCSGEFYICYDGDPPETTYPVGPEVTTTSMPTTSVVTSQEPPNVVRGSSIDPEPDNMLIYVILGVGLVVLVGVGLLVGCVVKRSQQRDKSRHLAEKRQLKLEEKQQKAENEDLESSNDMPLATRSLSVDSFGNYDDVNGKPSCEREGSDCSGNSSNSGLTSDSGLTSISRVAASGLPRTRYSLALETPTVVQEPMKRGNSISDIRTIGRIPNESRSMMIRPKIGSVTSLESIREVGLKYNMFDIPIERKLQQQFRRPQKYNTIGFSRTIPENMVMSGTATLPTNRTKTRAMIHTHSPSPANGQTPTSKEPKRVSITGPHDVMMGGYVYQDPQSLIGRRASYGQSGNPAEFRPIRSFHNEIAQTPIYLSHNDKYASNTSLIGQHNNAIYATIKKGRFKLPQQGDNDSGIINGSFSMDEDHALSSHTSHSDLYAAKPFSYFGTFKPRPGQRYYIEENVSDI